MAAGDGGKVVGEDGLAVGYAVDEEDTSHESLVAGAEERRNDESAQRRRGLEGVEFTRPRIENRW